MAVENQENLFNDKQSQFYKLNQTKVTKPSLPSLIHFGGVASVSNGAPTNVWVHFVQLTLVQGPYVPLPFVQIKTDVLVAICPGGPYAWRTFVRVKN